MKSIAYLLGGFFFLLTNCTVISTSDKQYQSRKQAVLETSGLIAFWDFEHNQNGVWISRHHQQLFNQTYPLYLRQIGDQNNYTLSQWPYTQENSKIAFDASGPFGLAPRFNQGHIYGAVPRESFDGSPLDLHARQAFTLISWVKFIGVRHMVAGIWDEGGWHKYAGRRQVALFAGLFQQKGVIAHVSATGAASYPQSTIDGSQYARIRAIDGQAFENDQWVMMAMTYDPENNEVKAYLNGEMTALQLADPVTQDVYQNKQIPSANPLVFTDPIYAPRSFLLKYNGYDIRSGGISEHRLYVNLNEATITYQQDSPEEKNIEANYRILFDIKRAGKSILAKPIMMPAVNKQSSKLEILTEIAEGDEIITSLEGIKDGQWQQIGTALTSEITEGAPFTFGRALGLDAEEIEHGSQLFLDGVAVFNRTLNIEELKQLSFISDLEKTEK